MYILPFSPSALAEAVAALQRGEVIAHATETCYGFACDLSNPDAVARLFAIKNRPLTQPVSALFVSIEQAKDFVKWNERAEELARKHLPGPLTLILPLRSDAPFALCVTSLTEQRTNELTNQRAITIGIRVSSHLHAYALVAAFGSPLSTTSANLHGLSNPYSVMDIIAQFEDVAMQPDLLLDSGTLSSVPPSTVVDLTGSDDTVVRKGSV